MTPKTRKVTYTVSNGTVTINETASKPKDNAISVHGSIRKSDGKENVTLKGSVIHFTREQVLRGGFTLAEADGTVTVTATEFAKGRRQAKGVEISKAQAFLATIK